MYRRHIFDNDLRFLEVIMSNQSYADIGQLMEYLFIGDPRVTWLI